MTLVIAILIPRGVVLAADRRTLATNKKNGQDLVLSDKADKLLIGPNIAIALLGKNSSSKDLGRDAIELWLRTTYRPDEPFKKQIEQLFNEQFMDGKRGGFFAVTYRDGNPETYRTRTNDEPEYDIITTSDKARMKFSGSGNTVAGQLTELWQPSLAAFDMADVVDYCAFLIYTTHKVMHFQQVEVPSVGERAMIAVVDYRGAHLVQGGDYTVDIEKP